MPWVTINGSRYYRRSKRVGTWVRTEHLRGGWLAVLEADLDARARTVGG